MLSIGPPTTSELSPRFLSAVLPTVGSDDPVTRQVMNAELLPDESDPSRDAISLTVTPLFVYTGPPVKDGKALGRVDGVYRSVAIMQYLRQIQPAPELWPF